MEEGRFRRDLYERLNFVPLEVSPLRDRREDIPLLLRHCLDRLGGGRWIEVTPKGLDYLTALEYSWPGNVRELEQLSARLVLDGDESVGVPELQKHLRGRTETSRAKARPSTVSPVAAAVPQNQTPDTPAAAGSISIGLPGLLQQAEEAWLE